MSYAIRKDGLGWRAVNGVEDVGDDETYSVEQPLPIMPTADDLLKQQIAALESEQNARRIREAALGIDDGWLKALNEQIEALRAQVK